MMILQEAQRVNTLDMKHEHKIARLYYLEGYSQTRIAKRLGISVASVSRALARAKAAGIVQISIRADDESFAELETDIERAYGLDECRVTPSFEQGANTYDAIARILEDLLPRRLPPHGTLGVSWGETLKAVAERFHPAGAAIGDAVPTVGAMGTIETGIYPNSIAKTFADKLGGRAFLVNAPVVSDNAAMARQLLTSRAFQSVREIWRWVDVALVGCSPVDHDASFARNAIFGADEIEALRRDGAVGAVNFSFLRPDGSILASGPADRMLHIPLEAMRSFDQVILVAVGVHKQRAIQAALHSRIITSLITDRDVAQALQRR